MFELGQAIERIIFFINHHHIEFNKKYDEIYLYKGIFKLLEPFFNRFIYMEDS